MRSANKLFIAAVESSDDAIITKTLGGVITGWNHAAERSVWIHRARGHRQTVIDIVVPERPPPGTSGIARTGYETGQHVEHHETVRVNKDGRRIDISLSISPVKSAAGDVIGAAKVARATSPNASRHGRRFQRETEERQHLFDILSNTINSMVDAVLVADVNGQIVISNPAAERADGYSVRARPGGMVPAK